MSDLLHARFDRIRHDAPGDWQDVVQRVNGRRRRRRLALVGAIGAVVALGAPTALGLRGPIVNFFQSEPAPRRLVLDFARMDEGAPPGLDNHVLYGQTRKIFERNLENGETLTLWVASNKRGGFCRAWVGPRMAGGFGCLWGRQPLSPGYSIRGPISRDGVIARGPVLVEGSVAIDAAETIELQYEDGDADRQALTWVSEPISAAFFLFDVPEQHWSKGHRFDRLVVRDAEGRELHSEPFTFRGPPALDSKTGAPSGALQEEARKLITVRTHTGVEAAIWTAPAANGGTCQWLRLGASGFGGGCTAKGIERPVLAVARSEGSGVVLLSGGPARPDVAEIEVRYEDGKGAVVPMTKGTWLYEVKPVHLRRGHRAKLLIARDANGKELARRRQEIRLK
jgi:hypothetical protein